MINLGNVMILGDSYSTFFGYIPEGFDYWYSGRHNLDNGVLSVKDTWWHKLMSRIEGEIVLNSSWSGTTVCHTGWRGEDCSHKSFIARFDELIDEGFFEKNSIDTLFIFGGTNDSWAGSPLGEVKFGDWSREELFSFCPAVCYLLSRVKEHLPTTRVIYIVNAGLKDEINLAVREACVHYGCETLFLPMMDRNQNHPTAKGMTEIADWVLAYLENNGSY
ncbi:MAG: hypothetical protein IJW48_01380 [Clostridia bacterium]|nr:hypothetical protein [Clostridia bacterium]